MGLHRLHLKTHGFPRPQSGASGGVSWKTSEISRTASSGEAAGHV